MSDTREHRKIVYGFCRKALKNEATTAQVDYALELVSPLSGHKALGFKTRLQMKADGESIKWPDF
jgi:hypothetical protein